MTRPLVALLLLCGCSEQAVSDVDGPQHCWDLDYDGEEDLEEDTNGDGVVDVYDCRGEDGGGSGSNGTDGQHCWDLDGDGIGDPEEDTNGDGVVDVYDCREEEGDDTGGEEATHFGALTFQSEADALAFCDRYTTVRAGSLGVESNYDGIDLSALACIRWVSHDVHLLGGTGTTDLSLVGLEGVGGSLTVGGSVAERASYPSLREIGDDLVLRAGSDSGSLDIDADLLSSIGRSLTVSVHADATSVSLDGLTEIGRYMSVLGNESLRDLDGFGSLESVGDRLRIANNDQLESISGLTSLVFVGENVEVEDNPLLPDSDASATVAGIASIGGVVTVQNNGG